MNHQFTPPGPGGNAAFGGQRLSDSGSPPDDSKIFLTVSYKYRYKLSCIVNVTVKFVNKLGKSLRRGEDYDVFFVNMRWKSC
jgi:hypothetical protein